MKLYAPSTAILLLGDRSEDRDTDLRDREKGHGDSFYQSINVADCDVITRSTKGANTATMIEDVHIAVQAFLQTLKTFPPPGIIDAVNRVGYGKIAPHFNNKERPTTANFHDLSRKFFRDAIGSLQERAVCLEIGAGDGWLRKSFEWPKTVSYSAVDIAPAMLDNLTFDQSTTRKESASARSLPFSSGFFDAVFCSLADGYCYPTALAEIRRVMKPGSLIHFTAPSAIWSRQVRSRKECNRTKFRLPDGTDTEVYSFTFELPNLKELFRLCGFQEERSTEITGGSLPETRPISEVLTAAVKQIGVSLDTLPIMNAITARKPI